MALRSLYALRVDLLPALSDYRPGVHQIGLRAGDDLRRSTFQVLPPSGLRIALVEGHIFVSGGPRMQRSTSSLPGRPVPNFCIVASMAPVPGVRPER